MVAEDGAERARAAGLKAFTVTRRAQALRDVSRVLHDLAEEYDGELVVVGRRHASMLETALLGSISASAIKAERLPVLVVPG